MTNSDFNLKDEFTRLGLSPENSVIIGSGILDALNIRTSVDVDVVLDSESYERLNKNSRFISGESYGHPILSDGTFEIRMSWGVLGREYTLSDFIPETVVIDGVRYISLEFLLRVKKSWLQDPDVRQKDIDDVKLIETYLAKENH